MLVMTAEWMDESSAELSAQKMRRAICTDILQAREVLDDAVRVGAANRRQALHHRGLLVAGQAHQLVDRGLLVEPVVARGSLEHRVLTAHVIRGRRIGCLTSS